MLQPAFLFAIRPTSNLFQRRQIKSYKGTNIESKGIVEHWKISTRHARSLLIEREPTVRRLGIYDLIRPVPQNHLAVFPEPFAISGEITVVMKYERRNRLLV